MEKDFVPPQESLELKELGFDEPCFNLYHKDTHQFMYKSIDGVVMIKIDNHNKTNHCSAPTFSQAFRFFREKFRLHSFIDIYPTNDEPDRCWYMIRHYDRSFGDDKDIVRGFFVNQEKAELGCLIRLINIVKEQK